MQQRTCNGILDSHHSNHRWVVGNLAEHLFKGVTIYALHLLGVEILVSSYVVERARDALYGNSLHTYYNKKTSRLNGVEAGCWCYFILVMFTSVVGTHLPALHFLCKVKVKEVCVKAQHVVLFIEITSAKVLLLFLFPKRIITFLVSCDIFLRF